MNCKGCKWCTWACPNWMCMNPKHPDFNEDDDYPVNIELNDSCELFESGENDYMRFQKLTMKEDIMKDYDIDTAREVVMDWFINSGKANFTSDDVADILDAYEESDINDLEEYLQSIE